MADKTPVLVIQCGGTIDKEYPKSVGGYDFEYSGEGPSGAERVLRSLKMEFDFEFHSCCLKDGRDITPQDCTNMVKAIAEHTARLVMITHDTAGIEASARAVHAALSKARVRDRVVAFVGSSLPECFEQSDAPVYIGMVLGAFPQLCAGVHTFGPLSSRTSIPQVPQGASEPEHLIAYDATVQIAAGRHRTVRVPLTGAGQMSWSCNVLHNDCLLSVFFRRPAPGSNEPAETELRAVGAVFGQVEDHWRCPGAGELVLVLDNSSSWLNGKEAALRVELWREALPGAPAEPTDHFSAAVGLRPAQHPNASPELKLRLHALYKQAVIGACSVPRPSGFNLTGKSKWDAWNNLGQMGQAEAKDQFVALVNEIVHGEGPNSEAPAAEAPSEGAEVTAVSSIDF